MKSFIAACVALALTVAAGIASSVVICRTADGLSKMAEALPPAGDALADGADALKRIDGIGSFWEGKRRAASVFVGEREAAAVTAAVGSLRAAVLSGDAGEYGSAREALLAAARDLRFVARFGV